LIEETEIRVQGRSVSRGVAIGRVVCLYGRKRQFFKIDLDEYQIDPEIHRLESAIEIAKKQIESLGNSSNEIQTKIFETHSLILEDDTLINQLHTIIAEQHVNSEWAIKKVTESYISHYNSLKDEHLKDRKGDFEDVMERVLLQLVGGNAQISLESDSIIVSKSIMPSTLIELSRFNLRGLITENGGWTSHTSILSREKNLPAVTNAKSIHRLLKTGDFVIVDGFSGLVVINPTQSTINFYQNEQNRTASEIPTKLLDLQGKLKTLDGREITILANLDGGDGYREAKVIGAEGIGLFRSENLLSQFSKLPDEETQFDSYRQVADAVGFDGVRIRTFDFSIEAISNESERNPALGMRGIRLGLTDKKVFRSQIRAILRASKRRKIDIVLPMISDISEIIAAKQIIQEEKNNLEFEGFGIEPLLIGVMIEVPAAVLMIDEIVKEVDFLCLGTNDLIQYLLAVDRDSETVHDWFRTLHPAVIRSLKNVVDAGNSVGIPVIVCGEMAGSPIYAAILIGLGVSVLSMNPSSITRIRQMLSQIAFEEAVEIVRKLLICRTAKESEELVSVMFMEKWAHVFPVSLLPTSTR
jgi:phosphoenolpyruvate-protein phosphotransferase (PTS system enzyme I)